MTDFDELQVNNSSHTICLVKQMNERQKDGFQVWAHEQVP